MTFATSIDDFLSCPTPQAWLDHALENVPTMLIDHANCEKKAASTAVNLIYRYTDNHQLLQKLSRLAREELRHFEQVTTIMHRRGIDYVFLTASGYASGLHRLVRKTEPGRLIDNLIVGSVIEARSCERFAALAPLLDDELKEFYQSLLKSEARHFQDYLKLAEQVAEEPLADRIQVFLKCDQALIEGPDSEFRFHSGVPL